MRKKFANIPLEKLATLIGLKISNRKGNLDRMENAAHFLTAQIHLYVLLYFYANSNDGEVSRLTISTLAKEINRDAKTVRKSLIMLYDQGLISMPNFDEDGEMSTFINDISDMYKLRGNGGHGYITCNDEMLDKILSARTINELRTVIGGLIVCTNTELNSSAKGLNKYHIALKDLRKAFPVSARPADVTAAVSEHSTFSTVFERVDNDQSHHIFVSLRNTLRGSFVKHQILVSAKNEIHAELKAMEEIIKEINTTIHDEGFIPVSGLRNLLRHDITIDDKISITDHTKPLPLPELSSNVVHDCCIIAQDMGIDTVIKAIHHFYTEYLIPGKFKPDQKKSLGGLLRSIATVLCQSNPAATALA